MSRVYIAAVLFAALLLLVFAADRALDAFHEAAMSGCDAFCAALASEDEAHIESELKALIAWWEQTEELLLLIVDHGHIDNIAFSMAKLPPLWESGEETELLVEAETIRASAEHLWRSESASFVNLF